MCRMIAAISKKGVKADWILAFEPLAKSGKLRCDMDPKQPGHGDGWGLVAYLRPHFPEYLDREPHSAVQDPENFKRGARLIEHEQSPVAIAHFRKISVGKPAISNTHPFLHGPWAFCHNGTIYESDKIPLKKYTPGGGTDSERFFLYLVEHLEESKADLADPKQVASELKKILARFKQDFKYSSLTFLLSDGKTIYAYRESGEKEFDEYYTLYTTQADGGNIVASEPLKKISSKWEPLPNDQLVTLGA